MNVSGVSACDIAGGVLVQGLSASRCLSGLVSFALNKLIMLKGGALWSTLEED